ncbi:MAG: hypothetical protein AB7T49_16070 [Oligoflexales bacterium]
MIFYKNILNCSAALTLASLVTPAYAVMRTKPARAEKIGVILPANDFVASQLKTGIEIALAQSGASPERVVFHLKKNGENPRTTFEGLLRRANIGMIINGAPLDAVALDRFASTRHIPLVHAGKVDTSSLSRLSFAVFPNETQLSATTAAYIADKKMSRVALLIRKDALSSAWSHDLLRRIQGMPAQSVEVFPYQAEDLNSMETAAKKLLKIDNVLRKDEWEKLAEEAQAKALEENVPFQPEKLMLPARMDFDVVVLPADFRNVKHFLKIFKYLHAPKFPMIGNQQWRAPELMDPPEPFLEGSVIVDFIPETRLLPAPLAQTEASLIDYQVIGYQSLSIALAAMSQIKPGERLGQKIAALQNVGTFGSGATFDGERRVHWPAFLYAVRGARILPLNWRAPVLPRSEDARYTSRFFPAR